MVEPPYTAIGSKDSQYLEWGFGNASSLHASRGVDDFDGAIPHSYLCVVSFTSNQALNRLRITLGDILLL